MSQIYTRTISGAATSAPIVLNKHGFAQVSLQIVVSSGSSTTWTVQQTLDDPNNPPSLGVTWFNHPDTALVSQTGNMQGNYGNDPVAIRITTTSGSTGTVILSALQSGLAGV